MARHQIHVHSLQHGYDGPRWSDPYHCEWGVVVGDRIRRLRKDRGWSLVELAQRVWKPAGGHYSAGYFSRLERGWASAPLYVYLAIADVLEIKAGVLLGEDEGGRSSRQSSAFCSTSWRPPRSAPGKLSLGWRPQRYDLRALPSRVNRHRVALVVGAALLALLVLAPSAFAGAFVPESGGSQNADDISTLYKITLYVSIVIFLIVEGTLIWSLVKFRARRDGPEPAQIRGNTPLELGWTMGAALILVVLTVVTFLYLGDIKDPPASEATAVASIGQPSPPGDSLKIAVNGQQYLWRYDYPGKEQLFSFHELVVPTGVTVELDVTASDVIHSWWIPELGGKVDGVPGHTNETWFKIDEPGSYEGQCAELCGEGHADMGARVVALSPDDYAAWAERQRADIKEAQTSLAEQRKQRESEGEGAL